MSARVTAEQLRDAALAYTEQLDWPVLPVWPMLDGRCTCNNAKCRPESAGKHPIPRGWQKTIPSASVARSAWGARFGLRGIGVPCVPLDAFGLDVDRRHGADVELRDLTRQHGRLPETVTDQTGNGWHLLFRQPDDFEVRNQGLGPDSALHTRGVGGYLVLPPSPHRSGATYRWLRDPFDYELAAAPEWLLERLRQRSGGPVVESDDDDYRIPEGQRYQHLIRFAGLLRSAGLPERAIVPMGLTFLEQCCEQEPAMDLDHAERQLRKVARKWAPSFTPKEERQ